MEERFSEQQVAEILRRAAEVQSRPGSAGGSDLAGITADELTRIGRELGIDANALAQAMLGVRRLRAADTGTANTSNRVYERTLQGELSEEGLAVAMEEFVPSGGGSGPPVQVGRNLNYWAYAGMAQCNVSLGSRNGITVLRVRSSGVLAALVTFLPAGFVALISTIMIGTEMSVSLGLREAVILSVTIVFATFLAATLGYRAIVRNSNAKVEEAMDRAAQKLLEAVYRENSLSSQLALQEISATVEVRE